MNKDLSYTKIKKSLKSYFLNLLPAGRQVKSSFGFIQVPSFFKSGAGFTLIEILVVLALISILSLIMFVNFSVIPKARDAKRKADLREIANSLEQYRKDKGQYPSASSGNVPVNCPMGTPTYFGNAPDCSITYLNKIPKDPNGSTWWRTGNYYYGLSSNGYIIFACIENTNDPQKWDFFPLPSPFNLCSTQTIYRIENT